MKAFHHRSPLGRRIPGREAAIAATLWGCVLTGAAQAQIPYQTQAGEMMLFKSADAARVVEKVRSSGTGVMFAVFVKVGDTVKKGQLLGHTELDGTKLQLDLARHAMESKANVEAARGQADAWTVTREETAEAARRRTVEKSRVDWALAMEKMYQGNYQLQVDAENAQLIQYEYWKQQYESRFFRAPVDGVVSEVLLELGKPVSYATHVFTIANDQAYSVSVAVPAEFADAAIVNETLPVRTTEGKSVSRAVVDSVIDDPKSAGGKIVRLLVKAADFPVATRAKLKGMKFDVLLPQVAEEPRQ